MRTQSFTNLVNYYRAFADRFERELWGYENETLENLFSIRPYYKTLLTARQYERALSGMSIRDVISMIRDRAHADRVKDQLKHERKLEEIYAASPLEHATFSIDWVKNRTWGYCPRGTYWNGEKQVEYRSVTGCGYDKLSTLTARMLNSDPHALRLLVDYIDQHKLEKITHDRSGFYGFGLYILPDFNEGVGISSHRSTFEMLGFTWEHRDLKHADFIAINR